jgi:hypothetical protein
LDDISGTNVFTFPVDMQKQPPGYENIPALAEESLPASKKRKKEKKAKASTQVILSVDVQRCTARALATMARLPGSKMQTTSFNEFLNRGRHSASGSKMHILMA